MRTVLLRNAASVEAPQLACLPPSPPISEEKALYAKGISVEEYRMSQELASIRPESPARSVWKRGFWWFQAVVTCALLFTLCQMCDGDRLSAIWTSGDLRFWLIAVVFTNLSLLAGGLALLVLIRPDGKEFSQPRFLLDYLHVQSLCQVTPGQIGEAMLPFMRGSATVPPGTIAAGLLLQRMVAVLIISVIAVAFASSSMTPGYVILQIVVVILGCTAITYLIGHDGLRAGFNDHVGRRYGSILNGFYASWVQILQEDRLRRLLPHACLMILRLAMSVLGTYFVFLSFDIHVPVFAVAGIVAISTLATVVPISLNGLGIVESIMVLSLRRYGLSSEEVLSVCFMGRSLWMLVLLSWSLLFWMVRSIEDRASQPTG